MDIYPTPAEVLRDALVDRPVLGFRPHAAARAAKWFVDHFPGATLYAVKADDLPAVLDTLFDAGIRHFDVASSRSCARCRNSRADHARHGSREVSALYSRSLSRLWRANFCTDSETELEKIAAATGNAKDLTLVVRVACPSTYSEFSLEGKFGAPLSQAPDDPARSSAVDFWASVSMWVRR